MSEHAGGGSPRKILFADADPLVRALYAEEAHRAGFEPLVAADGTDAWRQFLQNSPDAVVAELDLTQRRGIPLVHAVRRTRLGTVIPIVGVSAGATSLRSGVDAVIAHDVDEYFEKPMHGPRLMWRLQELLDGRTIGAVTSAGHRKDLPRRVVVEAGKDFLQGSLADSDIGALFFCFAATSRSGKLVLMNGRDVRQLWFRRGHVVYAESNVPGEDLVHYLVDTGLVDPEAAREVEAEWQDTERSLPALMIASGAIGARAMFDALNGAALRVVENLFSQREGHYYLEFETDPGEFESPETVSIAATPEQLVAQGIAKHYDRAACLRLLSESEGPLAVSDSAHYILRELDEPYFYENLLSHLASPRPAEELLHGHPFDRDNEALAALTALWVVGAVIEQVSTRQVVDPRVLAAREAVASIGREHPDERAAREGRIRQRVKPRSTAEIHEKLGAEIMGALDQASADFAMEKGNSRFRQGDYDAAARSFEEAANLGAGGTKVFMMIAMSYLRMEDADHDQLTRAVEALKRVVKAEPERGEAYHWMGTALARMGYREEARLTLRRAVDLGSDHEGTTRVLLERLNS